jgi:hypothetical protein
MRLPCSYQPTLSGLIEYVYVCTRCGCDMADEIAASAIVMRSACLLRDIALAIAMHFTATTVPCHRPL